ncbi:Spindle pole body component [Wickerhamomyces ciferrii]|uniref:Spindle pole body component n=1 Tax=Wickerhamomyces ciferrii (strain ATCC 14091 / BCRC 22168 / CBS 111 / JCM 3599 / NBRC 0793 / NRRL Y-1031 F-60-10) TaxID=1206466 RepID=K0KTT3_WICCF|nr:Spindle pole body component [Wickerhamomyces ciferrii]CCH44779.1 Spindle pole body component [Wickerhamomyces ciferrii]
METERQVKTPYLNARLVNFQPLCSKHQKVKPLQLKDLRDLRVQEALIVKDLLYVLLGLEGAYIRYSEGFDPNILKLRLLGPDYKINKNLDTSLKDVTKRIVHLGRMYTSLVAFTEYYNSEKFGQIVQNFVYEVRQFLKNYIFFLDSMDQQFKFNKDFNIRQLEQDLRTHVSYKMLHLYEIVQTIEKLNQERSIITQDNMFANFIEGIRHDIQHTGSVDLLSDSSSHRLVKGGLLLKIVQDRIDEHSGDLKSFEFLSQIFNNISKLYIDMLNDWITKGILNDQNNEFFIISNLAHDFKINSLNSERYWDSKYIVKKDGLPKQFDNPEIQYKVLQTGKYLNVLREVGVELDSFFNERVTTLSNSNNLYLTLDNAYENANKLILDLFFHGYNFKKILKNLQKYYLLNNIGQFQEFLNTNFHEFKKPYTHISKSKLQRTFDQICKNNSDVIFQLLNIIIEKDSIYDYLLEILKVEPIDAEKALTATNFDSIKTLINETLDFDKHHNDQNSDGNNKSSELIKSINFFTFDIILPFPLNLIINRTVIIQFQLIFRHLINLHYTDKQLNETWFEINQNKIWKYKFFNKSISKWITRVRSLHDRMKDFIKIYFGFLVYDLIDLNWGDFLKKIDDVENFEDLSNYLQFFLNTILKSSILTTDKLIKIWVKISQIINGYCNFLLSLRKVLILLDLNLFTKYDERLKGQLFDEEKNFERFEKLNLYLNDYLEGFSQHLNGFIEGLRYYGELETPDFLILAIRLESSFPSKE